MAIEYDNTEDKVTMDVEDFERIASVFKETLKQDIANLNPEHERVKADLQKQVDEITDVLEAIEDESNQSSNPN